MYGYLGETVVNVEDTEFKDFTPVDWTLFYNNMVVSMVHIIRIGY